MTKRLQAVLTVINLALLIFLLAEIRPVKADSPPPVLRGRALEIVDDSGKVRASIQVVPKGPARRPDGSVIADGKAFPEAVVLRLTRPDGRPSVKIATTEEGTGLDLSGNPDPSYIVLRSEGADTSITLTDKNGRRQIVKP